jgi:uncharacterized protein YndB with AHSA1/START domain
MRDAGRERGVDGGSTTVRFARTPAGRRIVVARVVDVEPARAWRLLRDAARWPEWSPSLRGATATDRYVVAGTRGRLRLAGVPVAVPFRVDAVADRRWTWRVAGVPATGHAVTATGDGRARVAVEVPPLAAAYVPACLLALRRFARLAEATGDGAADGGSGGGDAGEERGTDGTG